MSRIVCGLLSLVWAVSALAAEPRAVVKDFHAALVETMKHGEKLGCDGRIGKLAPLVDKTFDLPFIARHILRRHWEQMTPAQREEFTRTLGEITVLTYARNFSRDSGVKFETKDTRELTPERRQVRTILTPAHDEPVTLDYFVQKSGEDWRVINVIANGVSDLALRSAQYERIFDESGYQGLMDKLRSQLKTDRANCD